MYITDIKQGQRDDWVVKMFIDFFSSSLMSFYFYFICISVCLCGCGCTMCPIHKEAWKGFEFPVTNTVCGWLWALIWIPGTKFKFSATEPSLLPFEYTVLRPLVCFPLLLWGGPELHSTCLQLCHGHLYSCV